MGIDILIISTDKSFFYSDQVEVEEQDEEDVQQELNALVEDANTPLHTLLAKYGAAKDPKGTQVCLYN